MLAQLTIHNFGLIDELSADFCGGLNIFTGETGAGKSILIDALRYVLGSKLNPSQLRDRSKNCLVEAVFELNDKHIEDFPLFAEYLKDDEMTVIIQRTSSQDGRSKNKINGFSVTLSQLKDAGNCLIDFHGPHDHQLLLSESLHIEILDSLCGFKTAKKEYEKEYSDYLKLLKQLEQLEDLKDGREREIDMLSHQIRELSQVSLEQSDYDALLKEYTRVNNSEKLYEASSTLLELLENESSGMNLSVTQAFTHLKLLNKIDPSTDDLSGLLATIQNSAQDMISRLQNYVDSLSFDPGQAEEVNKKYDTYYEILRKFGPEIKDAENFYLNAKKKYLLLNGLEDNNIRLQKDISLKKKELSKRADKLTKERIKTASILKSTIESELKELGIKHVLFECRISKTELNHCGHDNIAFYISPNAGEELKPLAEIVSSGEAARVMLALKKALTKVDSVPVLIFDEIDAQIGGRLGAVTGKKLKELSKNRQIILITHLPQIASFGDFHFKVTKKTINNRTVTNLTLLEKGTRIEELSHMMSGDKESKIASQHAKEMLARANTR